MQEPEAGWVRGYESDESKAVFSILPGKRAYFVILDGELDAENPPSVVQTWVASELVWQNETV
jgi:hypothetical protein